jgi:hypothetical protein
MTINFLLLYHYITEAWVCSHSIAGIVGSNPPGAWISLSFECSVLSGGGLRVGLITCPGEFYRLLCLSVIADPR